jgi:hypothetical protein
MLSISMVLSEFALHAVAELVEVTSLTSRPVRCPFDQLRDRRFDTRWLSLPKPPP